jgi:hypothetical protein
VYGEKMKMKIKIKIKSRRFVKAHLFGRQGGERAAERLNVLAVVGGDRASRSPNFPVQYRGVHISPGMTVPASR